MPEGSVNPLARFAAPVLAALAAIWLCYGGAKHELAMHFSNSPASADWERAVRIEPDNPEIWYRMGRYRQLDFDNADFPLAITYYRRAVQLNPPSPYYKLDLADTLEMSGNIPEADRYFQAAQEEYPISPEVDWKYGNFLLRQERLPEAFMEIHRALLVDPKLTPLAISRVWHSDPDVHLLLDQILPDTPESDIEALNFFAGAKDSNAALVAWNRLIPRQSRPRLQEVFAITDLLIAQDRFADAGTVWRQAVARDANAATGYSGGSVIFDGGFEQEISGGGFGWQRRSVPGTDFDFDSDLKHSGSRSARLTFDGTQNLNYEDLFQYVLVSPSTRYHFRAFLRTDQISTDSGIRFELMDPKDQQHSRVLTPNETGTEPWTLEEADFDSGPQTHLVLVRLIRRPSQHLDNKIRGSVWIDDVSLIPIIGAGK